MSRHFRCPEPFRSPILPLADNGVVTHVDCYKARPVDGGRLFEVTHYHHWIRPDTQRPSTYPYEPELLLLEELVIRFKQL